MMEEKVYLRPFGIVDGDVLERIECALEAEFGLPLGRMTAIEVPPHALSSERGQYHSTAFLSVLMHRIPDDALRILGITDVDLFVPQLNFVFGEAVVDGRVGVISLCRLHPEFYGESPDGGLFAERAEKEAIHELGHTFGLRHCSDPGCVMYFSNTIADTDRKSARFCGDQARELTEKLQPLRVAAA